MRSEKARLPINDHMLKGLPESYPICRIPKAGKPPMLPRSLRKRRRSANVWYRLAECSLHRRKR